MDKAHVELGSRLPQCHGSFHLRRGERTEYPGKVGRRDRGVDLEF